MNYRTLVVNSTHAVEAFANHYDDHFDRVTVRLREHTFSFDITVYENGARLMRKIFTAVFNENYIYGDESMLAAEIIQQMRRSKELYVYDSDPPPRQGDEWTNKIIMDPVTKEIFSWLSKYTQRLIESF